MEDGVEVGVVLAVGGEGGGVVADVVCVGGFGGCGGW